MWEKIENPKIKRYEKDSHYEEELKLERNG